MTPDTRCAREDKEDYIPESLWSLIQHREETLNPEPKLEIILHADSGGVGAGIPVLPNSCTYDIRPTWAYITIVVGFGVLCVHVYTRIIKLHQDSQEIVSPIFWASKRFPPPLPLKRFNPKSDSLNPQRQTLN